jgi:hypothetical protein
MNVCRVQKRDRHGPEPGHSNTRQGDSTLLHPARR